MRSLLKLIVLSLVAAVALAELYEPVRPFFELQGPVPARLGQTWLAPAIVHSLLAIFVLILVRRRQPLRGLFALKPVWPFVPGLVVIAAVALMILVSRQFGDVPAPKPGIPWAWVLWIPVIEEIVFRAGIGDAFRRSSGSILWGSWFSALTFALIHSNPTVARVMSGQVGLPVGPFLLGLLCEGLYAKTGRILPVILLHAACNATAALFALGDARWFEWLGFLYS